MLCISDLLLTICFDFFEVVGVQKVTETHTYTFRHWYSPAPTFTFLWKSAREFFLGQWGLQDLINSPSIHPLS